MTTPRLIAGVVVALGIVLALTIWRPSSKQITPPAKAPRLAQCPYARAQPGTATETQVRAAITCLVNNQRIRHGLRPLRLNRALRRAAHRHALVMEQHNVFAHVTRFDGGPGTRAKVANYVPAAG